jgi:hypothetical protein
LAVTQVTRRLKVLGLEKKATLHLVVLRGMLGVEMLALHGLSRNDSTLTISLSSVSSWLVYG